MIRFGIFTQIVVFGYSFVIWLSRYTSFCLLWSKKKGLPPLNDGHVCGDMAESGRLLAVNFHRTQSSVAFEPISTKSLSKSANFGSKICCAKFTIWSSPCFLVIIIRLCVIIAKIGREVKDIKRNLTFNKNVKIYGLGKLTQLRTNCFLPAKTSV